MVKFEDQVFPDVKIAILLAAYQGNNTYFKEQLDSIASQSCKDFVCFLHDDGSKDGTPAIIDAYCNSHMGKFVNMGSHRVGGAKQNFLYMLSRVEADYIMFCDGDDVWLPEKIEKTLIAMKELESKAATEALLCVYSDAMVADENLKVIASSYFDYMGKNGKANSWKELLKVNVAVGHTMMINRALQKKALMYQDSEHIFMHDWWCALLASLCGDIFCIEEPLSLYRQHGNNSVGAKAEVKWFLKWKKLFSCRKWIASKRLLIDRPRNMAKELLHVLPKEDERYVFFVKLAEIDTCGKKERIQFYRENDLFVPTGSKVIQSLFI